MTRFLILLPLVLLLSVGCQTTDGSSPSADRVARSNKSTAYRQEKQRYGPLRPIPRVIPKSKPGDSDPRRRSDQIAQRYPEYRYRAIFEDYKDVYEDDRSAELAKAFEAIRREPGWSAFVDALATGDSSVNSLLEQDIVNWNNAAPLISQVTRARNAWRKASTFGITPPPLPLGWYRFTEKGITFMLHVRSSSEAVIVARSPRGRLMGVFELALWADGGRHLVNHMLQRPFRYPDLYLNYPWNVVMVTDTIWVDDVDVILDRLQKEVTVLSSSGSVVRQGDK